MLKIDATNEQVAARDQQDIESSEKHIGAVVSRFARGTEDLAEIARRSRAESVAVREKIGESLVQVQFQDRVSQMLDQVVSSMMQLGELAEQTRPPANVRVRARAGERDDELSVFMSLLRFAQCVGPARER